MVFAVTAFVSDGSLQALLRGTTWLVLGVAFWTFLWTYGSLALGLDRLGRTRLRPDAVRVDPGLGLRPLGDVAFLGLWLLLASLVPVLLTGLPDVVGVVAGAVVLALGLLAFMLSLLRLHRQMVEVKEGELAVARELYARPTRPSARRRRSRRSRSSTACSPPPTRWKAGAGDPRLAARRGDTRARDHSRNERGRDHDRAADPRPVRLVRRARPLLGSRTSGR